MTQTWSATERADIAQTLLAAGPGAPTLCAGWQTQHLAAHLVLRDRTPWRMSPGRLEALAASSADPDGYAALVAQVAEGPGRLTPGYWFSEQMNLLELFVHSEDVRRAGPGASRSTEIDPAYATALWKQFRLFSRLLLRPAPVGVVLVVSDGPRTVARKPRSGSGTVVVTGDLADVILFAFGRGASTELTVQGDEADVRALVSRFPGPSGTSDPA